jgi:undecaprenyl-diphosphatase
VHSTLLHRLGARDRALFHLFLLPQDVSARWRLLMIALTHLGGPAMTIVLGVWPLLLTGRLHALGVHAIATLVLSHAVVQLVKRSVGRPRPSLDCADVCFIPNPDLFSFPSGHAAAALSIALAYAAVWPVAAVPIVVLAALVGGSRVALGVHYPGDVAAGQSLALITHLVLAYAGV